MAHGRPHVWVGCAAGCAGLVLLLLTLGLSWRQASPAPSDPDPLPPLRFDPAPPAIADGADDPEPDALMGQDPADGLDREFLDTVSAAKRSCAFGTVDVSCGAGFCVLFARAPDALDRLEAFARRPAQVLEPLAERLGVPVERLPCTSAHRFLYGSDRPWTFIETAGNGFCSLHALHPASALSPDVLSRGVEVCARLAAQSGATP